MRTLTLAAIICCAVGAIANLKRAPADARKVEEFANICCDDEKARLDAFVSALRQEPSAQGYIIFYGGRRHAKNQCGDSPVILPRRGEAEVRAERLKSYMGNAWRDFDANRIVLVDGGFRESWMSELWVVPKGANPPKATPTVKPEEIKYRRGTVHKRDYRCEV